MIRRPVAWLFSGWNCVPDHVVARDDRRHRPAIVHMRHQIARSATCIA